MSSISDLSVFVEVVRSGSFVAAARRLNMTPSGVSKKIGRLEHRLNVRLFNRTTRSLSLTDAGNLLYERGVGILESVDEVEDLVKELSGKPKGTLRIAASDAFAKEVLVPFLSDFLLKYPELNVVLIPGDGDIDLLDRHIDVAIRFTPPSTSSFIARKLIEDPWVLCASPEYIEKHGEPDAPAKLEEHRCLLIHTRHQASNYWQFNIKGVNEEVKIDATFSGIGLVVKEAALRGMGIARLAHFLISPELEQGTLKRVLGRYAPQNRRAIYFVYPNRQHLPLKVRVLIDELNGYASTKMAASQLG